MAKSRWRPDSDLYVLFGTFVFLLLIGTPVAFCLGVSSFATIVYLGLPPAVVFQRLNSGVSAFALMVIGCAVSFGWLLAYTKVPASMVALLQGVSDNPIVILLLLNLLLLILGTFMDMSPLIVITRPIFLPVATAYGVDPVHFGVILILNLGIGLCRRRSAPCCLWAAQSAKFLSGMRCARSGRSMVLPWAR